MQLICSHICACGSSGTDAVHIFSCLHVHSRLAADVAKPLWLCSPLHSHKRWVPHLKAGRLLGIGRCEARCTSAP